MLGESGAVLRRNMAKNLNNSGGEYRLRELSSRDREYGMGCIALCLEDFNRVDVRSNESLGENRFFGSRRRVNKGAGVG